MYFTEIDGQPFAVKPMNAPAACSYTQSRRRSYRDLPLRLAELGQVHRHEMSGVLHGLFRVRYFTQDGRPHLLHPRAARGPEVRGGSSASLQSHLRGVSALTTVKVELSTRPAKEHRFGRDVGTGPRHLESRAPTPRPA